MDDRTKLTIKFKEINYVFKVETPSKDNPKDQLRKGAIHAIVRRDYNSNDDFLISAKSIQKMLEQDKKNVSNKILVKFSMLTTSLLALTAISSLFLPSIGPLRPLILVDVELLLNSLNLFSKRIGIERGLSKVKELIGQISEEKNVNTHLETVVEENLDNQVADNLTKKTK